MAAQPGSLPGRHRRRVGRWHRDRARARCGARSLAALARPAHLGHGLPAGQAQVAPLAGVA